MLGQSSVFVIVPLAVKLLPLPDWSVPELLSLKTKKPQNKPQPLINLKCEFDKGQILYPNSTRPDITRKFEKIEDRSLVKKTLQDAIHKLNE